MIARHLIEARCRYALRRPAVVLGMAAAALAVAALLLVGGWRWLPAYRAEARLRAAHAQARAELHRAALAGAVARAYEAALPRVERLEAKLHAEGDQAALIAALHELAGRQGVQVLSQAYQAGRERHGLTVLEHELSLVGPYAGIRGFISGLAQLRTWTEVRRADIERDAGTPGQVRAALQLATYHERAALAVRER